MKISFIHTADLHLGRQFHFSRMSDVYVKDKRTDLWETFNRIINTAENNKITFLLISGDIFDSESVDLTVVRRFADLLATLSETRVILCAGNHDMMDDTNMLECVDWPENVTFFNTGDLESVYFEDVNVEIYGMSWVKKTYQKMPFSLNFKLDCTHTNILMLHGDAYNTKSEYLPIDTEKVSKFDYVALGHIHKHDFITPKIVYAGSPEALSFGEKGKHGVIVGEIKNHTCNAQFIPISKREYHSILLEIDSNMTLTDIRNQIVSVGDEETRRNDYYRITLTGYKDPEVRMEWLRDELLRCFYYLELDDTRLQTDLDIDQLYTQNKDNIIGKFIEKINQDPDDPVMQKALKYGLESILKEKVIL